MLILVEGEKLENQEKTIGLGMQTNNKFSPYLVCQMLGYYPTWATMVGGEGALTTATSLPSLHKNKTLQINNLVHIHVMHFTTYLHHLQVLKRKVAISYHCGSVMKQQV